MMNTILAPEDFRWGMLALGAIARSTLILAGAGVAALTLHRSSAAVRHGVWTLALAAALIVPLLSVSLPAWSWSILPASTAVRVRVEPTPNLSTASAPSIAPSSPNPTLSVDSITSSSEMLLADLSRTIPRAPGVAVVDEQASRPIWSWIAGIWIVGAGVVLIGPFSGSLLLGITIRKARILDRGPLADLKDELSTRLGVRRRVNLFQGNRAQMPMTWGCLRPVILFPAEVDDWTPERRRDVLLHELAHVRRFDCLTQALAQLACAAYWFNPLAWIAATRMRVERERACDDLVLTLGGLPSDYAGSLLEMARKLRSGRATALAAVAMARPSHLEGRLLAILDPARPRGALDRRSSILATVVLAMVVLPISAVRLTAQVVKAAERQGREPAAGKEQHAKTMIVNGRVLDPNDRPVGGAVVDLFGRPNNPWVNAWNPPELDMLGHATSAEDGRFRTEVPRTSSLQYYDIWAMASVEGYGIVQFRLDPDIEEPVAEIRLEPEQIRTIKLVDAAGKPATNLQVTVVGMFPDPGKNQVALCGYNLNYSGFPGAFSWPVPEKTDGEGRLRLTRIGPGSVINLFVRDVRFSRQALILDRADRPDGKDLVIALKPAKIIEGRVLAADTGRPIANAEIGVYSMDDDSIGATSFRDRFRADREGRYRINSPSSRDYAMIAYPPPGEPYPIHQEMVKWTGGVAQMHHDIVVPRGVVVRGKIVESGSRRPLPGSRIEFIPSRYEPVKEVGSPIMHSLGRPRTPVASKEDGSFEIALLAGDGHFTIFGPGPDFVAEPFQSKGASRRIHVGPREYAHKFIPYEVKADAGQTPLEIELKPALTVRGRVVGPQGQAIEKATILTILDIIPGQGSWSGFSRIPARDGRFEIHGVSPDAKARVSVLDAEHEWGATFEVGKEDVPREIAVVLRPCGLAKARLVDADGRPCAKQRINFEFVATSGAHPFSQDPKDLAMPPADIGYMNFIDPKHYSDELRSDSEGRVTFPALIPGARYWLVDRSNVEARTKHVQVRKDFAVKPGETLDLGDISIEKSPASPKAR